MIDRGYFIQLPEKLPLVRSKCEKCCKNGSHNKIKEYWVFTELELLALSLVLCYKSVISFAPVAAIHKIKPVPLLLSASPNWKPTENYLLYNKYPLVAYNTPFTKC